MAGIDLRHVRGILDSSQRINVASLARFTKRFARFNLRATVIRPTYGLPEATAYVATRRPACSPQIVRFESEKLSVGQARRRRHGTALISYGIPWSPAVRIVNPDSRIECPPQTAGEIWVHGDNVAMGYWHNHQDTERTFQGRLLAPSPGTPEGPWLRTGDLGFFFDAELFIMGRIRDLLIVDGPNRYPGKVPPSAPCRHHTEKLVAIGDQCRDVSREDPTDPRGRFSDFLPPRATPPRNGESISYKMSGGPTP